MAEAERGDASVVVRADSLISNCKTRLAEAPRTENANHERERVANGVPSQSARAQTLKSGGGRGVRFVAFCASDLHVPLVVGLRKSG